MICRWETYLFLNHRIMLKRLMIKIFDCAWLQSRIQSQTHKNVWKQKTIHSKTSSFKKAKIEGFKQRKQIPVQCKNLLRKKPGNLRRALSLTIWSDPANWNSNYSHPKIMAQPEKITAITRHTTKATMFTIAAITMSICLKVGFSWIAWTALETSCLHMASIQWKIEWFGQHIRALI